MTLKTRIRTFGLAAAFLAFAAPAADAADLVRGKKLALQQCAVCHGLDGIAKRPDVPHIAGESKLYLKEQLKAFRSGDRRHEQMSLIAKGLKEEDLPDLIAWYAAIKIKAKMPK